MELSWQQYGSNQGRIGDQTYFDAPGQFTARVTVILTAAPAGMAEVTSVRLGFQETQQDANTGEYVDKTDGRSSNGVISWAVGATNDKYVIDDILTLQRHPLYADRYRVVARFIAPAEASVIGLTGGPYIDLNGGTFQSLATVTYKSRLSRLALVRAIWVVQANSGATYAAALSVVVDVVETGAILLSADNVGANGGVSSGTYLPLHTISVGYTVRTPKTVGVVAAQTLRLRSQLYSASNALIFRASGNLTVLPGNV